MRVTGLRWLSDRLAAFCSVLAMLVWALLPAGTMPLQGPDGQPFVVLCSGDGPIAVSVGADGQIVPVHPAEGGKDKRQPCPFSALHVAATAPVALALPVGGLVPVAGPGATRHRLAMAAPRFLRPETRGPPVLS